MMKIKNLRTRNKALFKYSCSFFIFILNLSCEKNSYDYFKPIDGGVWNIMAIKTNDNYLVGSNKYEIVYGNYLYIDFKHKKILIEVQNKEINGDFEIKQNGKNYKFVIFNTSDSLYNQEYNLVLDTLSKGAFSTQYNLFLKSHDIFIAAKKIQMGPDVN